MKKILTALLAAGAVLLASAAKPAGTPAIEFSETAHDFGTIREDGGNVSCEFAFKNTGDAPLLIVNATASCGCTRPNYPKQPVAPGKTGIIKVTYHPKGRPGEFDKTVTVRTNVKDQKKVTLKITGVVLPEKHSSDE